MTWTHFSILRFEYMQIAKDGVKDSGCISVSTFDRKGLEVYCRLPVKDAQDCEILKDALLKRFNLTEKGFEQKFKSPRAEVGEAHTQLIARCENYLMRWIDLANVQKCHFHLAIHSNPLVTSVTQIWPTALDNSPNAGH